jgi:hypothetical protein
VGRLLRPALLTAAALALAVGLTLVAAIALGGRSGPLDAVGPSAAPAVGVAGRPGVAGDVASLQARLKAVPGDHRACST